MRVLVTGGNGFIGSHVVDALIAAGQDVSVLDVYQERYRPPLPGVRYFKGSFGDANVVAAALHEGIDTVIHLANYGLSLNDSGLPTSDLKNLEDSVKLFEACIEHKVGKVVYMSSGGKIYGIAEKLPITESHPTNPLGSYGITKLAIEKHLLSLSHYSGIGATIVRPSNPYGIRQAPQGVQGVIPIFAWRILHQQPITIWGEGNTIRDYVDVKDVATACVQAASHVCSGVYNLGSGVGIETIQVLGMISDLIGAPSIIKWEPARTFDVPAIVLDSSRAEKDLNWRPDTDIRCGLLGVIQWLEELARSGQ
jgi:UDP-glucose 4-epimerase